MFSFVESNEISARFYRKVFRQDLFTKITFRKNVHAVFTDIRMLTSSCPFLAPTMCFKYIYMSTRSSKGIGLLLVEPLNLERVIHKSKREVDTLQAAIGSVEI